MKKTRIWTDQDILDCPRITTAIAAEYLDNGWTPMGVACRMRAGELPIGSAILQKGATRWHYAIVAERLIAYKHGRLSEHSVDAVLDRLDNMMSEIQNLRQDIALMQMT